MEEEKKKKSRVLIIGATGRLGHYLTRFSIESGHQTAALIRNSTFSDLSKSDKLKSLSDLGVTLLKGSLEDEVSLEEAVKKVDVVISAIPSKHVLDQKLLIKVIKQAGSIKRFIPADSGANPDKTQVSDLDHGFYAKKSEIRHLIATYIHLLRIGHENSTSISCATGFSFTSNGQSHSFRRWKCQRCVRG